ncbi:hypothetical protein COV61_00880, partial [Candidatus Micrarchaeota archaeon CG11_big_fil_rev_8_21_14_0_20_47_5]
MVIDGQGHDINGTNASGSFGVYSTVSGTTVRNIRINNLVHGVYFLGADGGTILNVSANSTYTDGTGMLISTSANFNQIINSSGTTINGRAIYIYSSSSCNITGSNGTSTESSGVFLSTNSLNNQIINSNGNSNTGPGCYLYSGSNYNRVINSSCAAAGALGIGILLSGSLHNNITNSTGSAPIGQAGIYLYVSSNYNQLADSTALSSTGYGLYLLNSLSNNITGGFASSNYNTAVNLTNADLSILRNITINSSTTCINVSATSGLNSFFHNKLYNCSTYVNNRKTVDANLNMFNTSVGGTAQGNYYGNIAAVAIGDLSGDGYGDSGAVYPYDSGEAEWVGWGADYGPIMNLYSCANITMNNTFYFLASDIPSWTGLTCFNITAENITLDLQGHYINGSNTTNTYGVYSNKFNTTIKNGIISNFASGIYFHKPASNGLILNNTIYSTFLFGPTDTPNGSAIFSGVGAYTFHRIINNTIYTNSSIGIQVGTYNNNISGNFINSTGTGMFTRGQNNRWTNNTVYVSSASYPSLNLYGSYDTVEDNTLLQTGINGIALLESFSDTYNITQNTIEANCTGASVCTGVRIWYSGIWGTQTGSRYSNNKISGYNYGIYIFDPGLLPGRSVFENNTITAERYGIW